MFYKCTAFVYTSHTYPSIFSTLLANSEDDKLMIFFLFFPRKHVLTIHESGDNLHEMSKPDFWENKKNILKCCLLNFFIQNAKRYTTVGLIFP